MLIRELQLQKVMDEIPDNALKVRAANIVRLYYYVYDDLLVSLVFLTLFLLLSLLFLFSYLSKLAVSFYLLS